MGLFSGPGQVQVNAFTNDPPTGGIYTIGQRYNITGVIAINGQSFGYSVVGYESQGRALITFFRMYGTLSNISLDYNTSNGTAIAGTDYTATSGTVSWLQGDLTPKTVSVPLLATSSTTSSFFNFNITGVYITGSFFHSGIYIFTGGSILPFPGPNYATSTSFPVTIIRQTNGTLNFAGTPYSVARPGGTTTVTLQVQRINGFKGAVGCSFHTTDGTAVSGVAYTGQTGTLSWAANEGGPKNIVITILSGGSGTQSFTVTIDTPTGGVAIGSTNIATVNIVAAAPPANPVSSGGIPDQIVDLQAGADPNGEIQFQPQNLLVQENQSISNKNFLVNAYGSNSPLLDYNSTFWVTTLSGWIVGDGGWILHTTDGGATWTVQASGTNVNLYDVFFSDATHGWAVGANGTILATTNGSTWAVQSSGVLTDLYGVSFVSNTVGWVVGAGGVIRTTANGSTWTGQTSGVATALNEVNFVDSTHGWAVGDGGVILVTTNGTSWASQTSGVATDLNGVYFTSTLIGWAVGDAGKILATTNGGGTWAAQASGTTRNLYDVNFQDSTHGWAVGAGGKILATTNGSTWVSQTSHTTQDLLAVDAASTSIAYVVGNSSTFLVTGNGGATWTTTPAPTAIGGVSTGTWGGGGDYGNYDNGFNQSPPIRFGGATYLVP